MSTRCLKCPTDFNDVRHLREHWLSSHTRTLDNITCWFCGARHEQMQPGSDDSWRCERCGLTQIA